MQVVFLATTKPDLRWFKRYYTSAFPEGRENADRQFKSAVLTLSQHPGIGRISETHQNAREFHIARTPFIFVCRVGHNRIEMIRVREGRTVG
jgi:plasmid stabilization system protein ParE